MRLARRTGRLRRTPPRRNGGAGALRNAASARSSRAAPRSPAKWSGWESSARDCWPTISSSTAEPALGSKRSRRPRKLSARLAEQETTLRGNLAALEETLKQSARWKSKPRRRSAPQIELELVEKQAELKYLDETSRKELNIAARRAGARAKRPFSTMPRWPKPSRNIRK